MSDTDAAAVARAVVELMRDGRFAEVESRFAPPLRAVVSARALEAAWAGELVRTGPVVAIAEPLPEPIRNALVRVTVPVTGEHGGLTVAMSVDAAGVLHGLLLTPLSTETWRPPAYAKPRKFVEQDVALDAPAGPVGGTLTLPRGRGKHPGVVLLSGGGAFDRDETSGANKPLKDLAWGLASRGIAVVRFDKVTFTDKGAITAPGFTPTDEYVPYAVAAVRLLQRQPGVDPARVFVAGHSMGGRVAPRVAAAEASVAGAVILAGDTLPMADSAVRVARYLASVSPDALPPAALAQIESQAARVRAADPTTPAADLPFGWPAAYWLDLRDDDPVAIAASLDIPLLILQGGRDYQVTESGDLHGWRMGLGDRPGVDIRVYEADDHLFFPGTGPSTPAGYEAPQHVDPAVVADIAGWLRRRR